MTEAILSCLNVETMRGSARLKIAQWNGVDPSRYLTIAQVSSFLFFSHNFSLHHSLDHLTPKFPSLLEPRLQELSPQISSCNLQSYRNEHIDSILSQQ